MPLLNPQTGELSFTDGFMLRPHMPVGEVQQRFATLSEGLVCLPAHSVHGGSIAPTCTVENGEVTLVTLHVHAVGGKSPAGAERQRAFLFSALGFKDPCPDTKRSVRVRCPFGEALMSSDPHTGQASARISYTAAGR